MLPACCSLSSTSLVPAVWDNLLAVRVFNCRKPTRSQRVISCTSASRASVWNLAMDYSLRSSGAVHREQNLCYRVFQNQSLVAHAHSPSVSSIQILDYLIRFLPLFYLAKFERQDQPGQCIEQPQTICNACDATSSFPCCNRASCGWLSWLSTSHTRLAKTTTQPAT